MGIGLWYWLILVIWIVLGGASWFKDDRRFIMAGNIVLIVLLILNGLADFGGPIK